MTSKPLSAYQTVVTDPSDIPAEKLCVLLLWLLDHLDLELIREATPDYTAFEIRSKQRVAPE